VQLGPFDVSLRAYARQQTGCRTLVREIYGIGPLTSVTILAELGDTGRFENSGDAVRYGGMEPIPRGRRPRKTERPQPICWNTPSHIMPPTRWLVGCRGSNAFHHETP
jgi:hypothetical protein